MSDEEQDGERSPEPVHLPAPAAPLRQLEWRWALAAAAMGALSALAAAGVRLGFSHLQWLFTGTTAASPVAGAGLTPWRRVLTPALGGLLATVVAKLRLQRAHRKGREPRPYVEYVAAVRHGRGQVPMLPNCWRTAGAAFSVATGAAVGREGSMIQFAAAVASWTGQHGRQWLTKRNSDDRMDPRALALRPLDPHPLDLRLLVAFGVAGGVTAAYGAPVAGMFFAAEIVLGALDARELPLLLLAAGAGRLATGPLLGWGRLYPAHVDLSAVGWRMLWLPLLAVLFGLLGPLYQELIRSLAGLKRLPLPLVWSGLLVGFASLADPRVWGNGDLGLSAALGRAELPGLSIAFPALALLLLLRLGATTICVGTGTVGGVFTPTLFAGGAVGALLWHGLARVPGVGAVAGEQTLWAVAGMSALLAAATHAPWTAALMAAELTGDWALVPGLLLLTLVSSGIAERLSGQALYAIASQSPGDRPGAKQR